MSIQSAAHFLISLFFDAELCELFIHLLVISLADIFSHSVGCVFILSMVFFVVQKLLSLTRSHLFILAFISFTSGCKSKKVLL